MQIFLKLKILLTFIIENLQLKNILNIFLILLILQIQMIIFFNNLIKYRILRKFFRIFNKNNAKNFFCNLQSFCILFIKDLKRKKLAIYLILLRVQVITSFSFLK